MLLLNVPGATSFSDLLTYNNTVYTSFQQVCKAQHFTDHVVCERTLEKAVTTDSSKQLRDMFSFMLSFMSQNCDNSEYVEQLRKIFIIIVNKYHSLSKYQFEAMDRLMRDIIEK